jgi:hypothetical protein
MLSLDGWMAYPGKSMMLQDTLPPAAAKEEAKKSDDIIINIPQPRAWCPPA